MNPAKSPTRTKRANTSPSRASSSRRSKVLCSGRSAHSRPGTAWFVSRRSAPARRGGPLCLTVLPFAGEARFGLRRSAPARRGGPPCLSDLPFAFVFLSPALQGSLDCGLPSVKPGRSALPPPERKGGSKHFSSSGHGFNRAAHVARRSSFHCARL